MDGYVLVLVPLVCHELPSDLFAAVFCFLFSRNVLHNTEEALSVSVSLPSFSQ